MRFLWTMRAAVLCAALVLLAACGARAEDPDADGGDTASRADAGAAQTCRITRPAVSLPPELNETSGAALDPRTPGLFWTHGDSGGEPAVYAIAANGQLAGRVVLTGARNRDWEDMAIGPCGGGQCVYAADIGNNGGRGRALVLYRAPLPAAADAATAPAEVFRAQFPGGAGRDAEAVFVTAEGEVYVINKGQRHPIELWHWPAPLQPGPVDLVRVRQLAARPRQPGDAVTGAGASEDGRWVAVRTYARLAVYRTADLLGGGGPAFSMELAPLGEPFGEAVAMRADGTVLLTSESGGSGLPGRAVWLQCPLPVDSA
ncbi:MAG TPA: hypothetical protein VFR37_00615 [Longimicrobium sp.]|nr:hypothetical protein [Longimicrobium sp.]